MTKIEPHQDRQTDANPALPHWQATVLTLFPDMFPGHLAHSLAGKSLNEGIWALKTLDIRDFARDKHRTVDDTPLGGGVGMVLKPDVVASALAAVADCPGPRLYLSPRGRVLDQALVRDLVAAKGAVFLCGRYEGVDQRVLDHYNILEVSLGDFVMTGGELAAQAMIDATVRLLPDVLGNAESTVDESHSNGLLEHPQYTRPAEWMGREIPEVLTSGNHAKVAEWRKAQSETLTQHRRPDLVEKKTQEEE